MKSKALALPLLFAGLGLAPPASPQDLPVAIRGATILTGIGDTIEDGTIVFIGGKIVELGANVAPPDGATVIEADGLVAAPGAIDAYTHVGYGFGNLWRRESLMTASRRVVDDVRESLASLDAELWLRSGVTTVYVSPGGQNLVGGLGAVVKLNGNIVRDAAAVSASFGETALNAFEAPTTRQGLVAILRQTFIRAQEDTLEASDGRTFAMVLTEELPFHVFVNTPDDILTALRMAKEFELNLVIESAAGAHVVASEIAAANVPVIVGPTIVGLGDGGPYEAFAHTPANAQTLHDAGVRIALSTGGFGRGRSVLMEALMAKAHGLSSEAALAAITSDAAVILGVEERVGALAVGRDADIVLWKGHPISTWKETQRVIVDGETVFQR